MTWLLILAHAGKFAALLFRLQCLSRSGSLEPVTWPLRSWGSVVRLCLDEGSSSDSVLDAVRVCWATTTVCHFDVFNEAWYVVSKKAAGDLASSSVILQFYFYDALHTLLLSWSAIGIRPLMVLRHPYIYEIGWRLQYSSSTASTYFPAG